MFLDLNISISHSLCRRKANELREDAYLKAERDRDNSGFPQPTINDERQLGIPVYWNVEGRMRLGVPRFYSRLR